jgi:hypothetical protein
MEIVLPSLPSLSCGINAEKDGIDDQSDHEEPVVKEEKEISQYRQLVCCFSLSFGLCCPRVFTSLT